MAFLEQIKANPNTRDILFIMLTVEAIKKTMNKALSLGVDSYIVKPVDFKQFTESIRQIGMYWLLLNERPVQ